MTNENNVLEVGENISVYFYGKYAYLRLKVNLLKSAFKKTQKSSIYAFSFSSINLLNESNVLL